MSINTTRHIVKGFSLVELSIVLVILGLLVGGVLSGQALIRAAELRTLTTDYSKFHSAIFTFRDKYFALPGDMPNATQFWGVAAGDGNAANSPCIDTATTDRRTCNGDGNGRISCNTVGCNIGEWFRIWQHLSNAGLIEGNYVGAAILPDYYASGVNMPSSKITPGGYWLALYGNPIAGTTTNYAVREGHLLNIQGKLTSPRFLRPEEAWNIDSKLDDGLPNRGGIESTKGTTALPCSTTANQPVTADVNSRYNLASQTVSCGLLMRF